MVHAPFEPFKGNSFLASKSSEGEVTPTQLRWSPFDVPDEPVDFVQGLKTVAVSGDPGSLNGLAIHIYTANRDMDHRAFYSADGDFLVGNGCLRFPYNKGSLKIKREISSPTGSIGYLHRIWTHDGCTQ